MSSLISIDEIYSVSRIDCSNWIILVNMPSKYFIALNYKNADMEEAIMTLTVKSECNEARP